MSEQVATFCRVCEPQCGLVATVEGGRMVALAPDRDHPVTKGFACNRGLAGLEINHDPDRLNWPQQRVGDSLVRRTWDEAIVGIAAALRTTIDTYGPQSVAVYLGNPASFNSLVGNAMPELLRRLGVTRRFTSATQDCISKWAASAAVFGASALHPLPDVHHADFILQFGANWRASKASFVSMPNAYGELIAAKRRGAAIWFVNPRVTESSGELTGETLTIKPDTDVYLLAAMLCEIDRTMGFRPGACVPVANLDGLRDFVRRYPPEAVADVCGIPAERIMEIARAYAGADRACAYMSTGVNMGRQGMLAYWLVLMLSLVTDNLDRTGGIVPGTAFYDVIAKSRSDYAAEGLEGEFGPMRAGDLPGGLLADYVLDAEVPIRALFVIAGNPLLSLPGEQRIRDALARLDLLVGIDVYPTATTDYAHWLLPATDQFEREDVSLSGIGMQVAAHVQATARVATPQHERRDEWWMFARLAQALGLPSVLDEPDPLEARWSRVDHMLASGGLSRASLHESGRGIQLSDGLHPGRLCTELLQTGDGRIDCCPAAFGSAIERCAAILDELRSEPEHQLKLISRRDSRMHNSWYANVAGNKSARRTTNRLAVNPADAGRLGIATGALVEVRSAWGHLTTEAEIDPRIRPGVVSLEHGWGLQQGLTRSRTSPGANVNRLMPHGPGSFDAASNQQQLTGIPVEVRAVDR